MGAKYADADFSGWVTKAGLKCSDGRTIMKDAFAHQDEQQVPLVWQHGHDDPENVLGHVYLENRAEGVYGYGYFNPNPKSQSTKTLVVHKDINMMSIYANQLVEKSKQVIHGAIREVSLVLAGANPGALIDYVRIAHSDGSVETLDDEAIIYLGEVSHSDIESEKSALEHAEGDEKTLKEVYDTLNEEQKELVEFMIGEALEKVSVEHEDKTPSLEHTDEARQKVYDTLTDEQVELFHFMVGEALEHSDNKDDNKDAEDKALAHQEGNNDMNHNVFEPKTGEKAHERTVLSHDQISTIVKTGEKLGSFKEGVLAHAQEYGITDIDLLFPDAKAVYDKPELIARRAEWVKDVLDGAKHQPFSRIKSLAADLTADEARAKGYVKGNLKKEEIIKLLRRVTTPTTIYKKQKLDRDDIVDITDFDVVAWLKWEMRFMLEEELARAILIGDGREPDDDDKIDEDHLRPIAWDNEMYAHSITVPSNTTPEGVVESILRSRKHYKGTGRPAFYTTDDVLTDMLLIKDKMNRYVYDDEAHLASKLRVSKIVVVEVMESTPDLLGIMVNMADYTIGADRGGQVSMFDDFDIDYNQEKYLIETRASGALTKPKSAVVIKRTTGTVVVPTVPTFDPATNALTIPTVAGVEYYDVTNPVGNGTLLAPDTYYLTATTDIEARATAGNSFPHNHDTDWTYAYNPDGAAAPVGDPTLPS